MFIKSDTHWVYYSPKGLCYRAYKQSHSDINLKLVLGERNKGCKEKLWKCCQVDRHMI